jgi:3-isopropylmalate/(R)-2-methylmalate dehydratase small subunit
MKRKPITALQSRTVVLSQQNIDTDQIIPARFLTTTEREGLGRFAFADWRAAGDCPLDDERAAGCEILVAGENFGCGSSREHAPWALLDFGFRAVISSSFADIFRQNAHKNGLLTVQVEPDVLAGLLAAPSTEVSIDVRACTLTIDGGDTIPFPLDDFARHCLLEGLDELAYLLEFEPAITAYETE